MQGYNCIMIYSQDCKRLLFCNRTKDQYKGLYNLVGGKIEKDENGYDAAYRELKDETGIDRSHIQLNHMMDITYYNQDCYVEVYVGRLLSEAVQYGEADTLEWLDVDENFFDGSRFAGEGNIGHMVEQVKIYGMGIKQADIKESILKTMSSSVISIGVDGCKGGWIAAILKQGKLIIDKYSSLSEIIQFYPDFDELLIDMVIGLPSSKDHIRPDTYARRIINERTSTIFPAPCRQAVYAKTVSDAYDQNERVLGKKFTPLTVGIIPKMRELDAFLQANPEYKNVIKESHPEVCFARLNGKTVLSKKSEIDGVEERVRILSNYIPDLTVNKVAVHAKSLKCNIDDIVDAVCLAVTANIVNQGDYDLVPENPMRDETGLLMQMVIPR